MSSESAPLWAGCKCTLFALGLEELRRESALAVTNTPNDEEVVQLGCNEPGMAVRLARGRPSNVPLDGGVRRALPPAARQTDSKSVRRTEAAASVVVLTRRRTRNRVRPELVVDLLWIRPARRGSNSSPGQQRSRLRQATSGLPDRHVGGGPVGQPSATRLPDANGGDPSTIRDVPRRQLLPTDVFTPNTFPLGESNVYAARTTAERGLTQAIRRHQIPVVFGEYGVGKTTLVKVFFFEDERAGRVVSVLSPAGKNFDDIAKLVLEALNYRVDVVQEDKSAATVEAGMEAGAFATLKARFTGRLERSRMTRRELLVTAPTDQGLLNVMADAELTLVIDEMHKAGRRLPPPTR